MVFSEREITLAVFAISNFINRKQLNKEYANNEKI